MRQVSAAEFEVAITVPGCWSATYSCTNQSTDNPWTWWAPGANRDVYPHFTIWANDVGNNGQLTRFHITKNYNNQTAKPMHIYYNVNQSGRVRYTNTDAARLGSQQNDGLAWVDENATVLDQLAQSFVNIALA